MRRQCWLPYTRKIGDMILADFARPRFNGIKALQLVKQQRPRIPLVIIADTPDEAEAVVLIKAGAEDYFSRQNQYRLVGKKCYEVFRNFDIYAIISVDRLL